jgi:RND family efflux transporter MFP subunit
MTDQSQNKSSQHEADYPGRPAASSSKHGFLLLIIAIIVVIVVVITGVVPRLRAKAALKTETDKSAVPTVDVIQPKQGAPHQEIVLPGNIQAFTDAPIYARTNGYLKSWYVDIGARVKAGQLLAVIDTPEVDQQLMQARADLNTAEANSNLSQITWKRYEDLKNTDSVSKQDVDNANGDYEAKKATEAASAANVKRLEDTKAFQNIYAPFDGVITARNTDIGDLINMGSSTGARTDLFHISQTGMLRVYVNVPEEYSQGVKSGQTTSEIVLSEFPGRKFAGNLVRTADAINATTRTLLVEIDVPNPTDTLLSGSYAEVHLKVPSQNSTFLLPASALLFRTENLQVGVVKNGVVTITDVIPGHDLGAEIEIVAGLKPDDQVVVNPPDSLVTGQEVQIVQTTLPGDSK